MNSPTISEEQAIEFVNKRLFAEGEKERLDILDAAYWADPKKLQREHPSLDCDECGKGFADCKCVLQWADDDAIAARQREIKEIRETFVKRSKERQKPKTVRVTLVLPEGLIQALKHRASAEGLSVSALAAKLLLCHSGETTNALKTWGSGKKVQMVLPEAPVKRLRARAKKEGLSISGLVGIHLEREMWADLAATEE